MFPHASFIIDGSRTKLLSHRCAGHSVEAREERHRPIDLPDPVEVVVFAMNIWSSHDETLSYLSEVAHE